VNISEYIVFKNTKESNHSQQKCRGRGLFPHSHKLLFVQLGVNRGIGNGGVTKVNLYGSYIMAVVYHKETAAMPQHARIYRGQGGFNGT